MTSPEKNNLEQTGADTTHISTNEFQPGQLVGGRYEIISRLGEGGMGLVYRVKQVFLSKEFALKTIDKNCMSGAAVRRFQQEARTSFALDHPNIITVNDFGVLDDQTPFLVMELVKGETLSERLKRSGCLTLDQAIQIFVQVCFGLAYAHERGLVHRDIKPSNIMILNGLPLGAEGSIKILDFGIAKFVEHEEGEIQALTRTGEIFGSPLYMSPEQCTGFRIDHRADIYSLGCVMFELLTGTPPFIGENALSTMMKHKDETAPTLKQASLGGDFPQAIEDIVARMLAKSPKDRYENLGIVAHDLAALRRGDSISEIASAKSARPASPSKEATISMSITNFWALMLGIAVLSSVIAWSSVYVLHHSQDRDSVAQPGPESIKKDSAAKPLSIFGPLDAGGYQDLPAEELKMRLLLSKESHRLDLTDRKVTNNSIMLITSIPWLTTVSLEGCSIDNEHLGTLAALSLTGIVLNGSTFNDTGASGLSLCPHLEDINANATPISDAGVRKLATIKALRRLDLRNDDITDDSLPALARSALENITLDQTKVTLKGIEGLCRISKHCNFISLKHCPNIGETEIQQLRKEFPAIKFLDGDLPQNTRLLR